MKSKPESADPSATTRRRFIQGAAASGLAGGLAPAASFAQAGAKLERIRVGIIGVGNRGEQLLREILAGSPSAKLVALCDVYEPYLARAARDLPSPVKAFSDYRDLLKEPDIDAVVIATPDHWHAKQFIDACRAGKDVYVEKPLSLTVAEGRRMIEVARETGRVTQMGAQRHSSPMVREACARIKQGDIGKLTRVRCFHTSNEFPNGIGRRNISKPPPGLDWDKWLGPAPVAPFEELVWNYKFRWFRQYSGGQLTNMGAHWTDLIHMALEDDAPLAVAALGGKFAVDDDREIPDTMEVTWHYRDCLVSFSQINANDAPGSLPGVDVEFRGALGTLYLYSNRYEIVPQRIQTSDYPSRGPLSRGQRIEYETKIEPETVKGSTRMPDHLNNFFDCVRSRERCNLDVETGHRSTIPTLIANIALRRRALLEWDSVAERFTNNDEANADLDYGRRDPWKV